MPTVAFLSLLLSLRTLSLFLYLILSIAYLVVYCTSNMDHETLPLNWKISELIFIYPSSSMTD